MAHFARKSELRRVLHIAVDAFIAFIQWPWF